MKTRSEKNLNRNKKADPRKKRNGAYFDAWSLTHITWGALLAWVMNPFYALAIMVLWEPLEVFVISPLVAKRGVLFGYETITNSLSDIVFDVIGVAFGFWVIGSLFDPPFYLF